MSEVEKQILKSGITRNKVFSVIIIAGILVSAFAFSTFIISQIFGSQRPPPSEELANVEYEDAELIMPPFPFNISLFEDLFKNLNLTEDELNDLIDMLSEMFDGNIDDLDLGIYAAGILALLLSDVDVFYVYDYDFFGKMEDILWKYECFDEYNGDGWSSSTSKGPYDFYTKDEYDSYHSSEDIYKIRMILSPSSGTNSFVIPSLFPTPYIMEDSVNGNKLDPGSATLYKDGFDCSILEVNFYEGGETTMDYELFGTKLPKGSEIDKIAEDASYTPESIKDKYLNLPPSIEVYKDNNPNFLYHWNYLNDNVIKDSDNAFIVADKIRNYLQYEFSFPYDPEDYEPAPDGVDTVEWFCQTQTGVWSDFASAFCVFSRSFGIASRFVDGFHSRDISQTYDDEEDSNRIAIKYRNIYNWGEIFVPTSEDGDGQWVQMDVYFENYGGTPPSLEEFNMTVTSDQSKYYRHELATINATLSSDTDHVDDRLITFQNIRTNQEIGSALTDENGTASIKVKINNTHIIGPNIIVASYNPLTYNFTQYNVIGNVTINLESVDPPKVNISTSNLDTNVKGYVYDPIYGGKVANATVNFLLFQNGTSNQLFNAFFPASSITNNNGDFDVDLTLNTFVVPAGHYELRADFNGSILGLFPPISLMNDSSDRKPFNVTEFVNFTISFFINDVPTDYPNSPIPSNLYYAKRGEKIKLHVNVSSTNYNNPLSGKIVEFYDYTNGNVLIGTNITNTQGIASLNYNLGPTNKSGPSLVYVKVLNKYNCSYFILNESIVFNSVFGPVPSEINRADAGSLFNIDCNLQDNQGNPISYGHLTLKMFHSGSDVSSYLNPQDVNQLRDVDGDGIYDIFEGVLSNTPLDNYTLRLDFNSTFDFTNDPFTPYPTYFNLNGFDISTHLTPELKIEDLDDFIFNFWINETLADDNENPKINRNGNLNLSVFIKWGKTLVEDGEWVGFYDITNNSYIGRAQIYGGWANLTYKTTSNTIAGPHLIYANYSKGVDMEYNYSYFILDAPIDISLTVCPSPRIINNTGSIGREFIIQGSLIDATNGFPIKKGEISVHMKNGITDYSNELELVGGNTALGDTGIIDLTYRVKNTALQLNYTLQVWFNGTFNYGASNKPYNFYLTSIVNFSKARNGLFQLKVKDPSDITITLKLDNNYPPPSFDDLNPPNIYFNEIANFTVWINKSGSPVSDGTVTFIDVYDGNNPINSSMYVGGVNGRYSYYMNTNLLHGGLHEIRIEYDDGFFSTANRTYIIINKTININITSLINDIQRNTTGFSVSGFLDESGNRTRALNIRILFFDENLNDASAYFNLSGSEVATTASDGSFSFTINKVLENCPQGRYGIRVDFNGSYYLPPYVILNAYHNTLNSTIISYINVTAGTSLEGNYYTEFFPNIWFVDDICHINGTLRWDNDTGINGVYVNATIWNETSMISANWNITLSDGSFEILLYVTKDWDENTEIYISFYPEYSFYAPDFYYIIGINDKIKEIYRQV